MTVDEAMAALANAQARRDLVAAECNDLAELMRHAQERYNEATRRYALVADACTRAGQAVTLAESAV